MEGHALDSLLGRWGHWRPSGLYLEPMLSHQHQGAVLLTSITPWNLLPNDYSVWQLHLQLGSRVKLSKSKLPGLRSGPCLSQGGGRSFMSPCFLLQGLLLQSFLLLRREGSHQPGRRPVVLQVVQQLLHVLLDHSQLPLALGQDTAGQVLEGIRCWEKSTKLFYGIKGLFHLILKAWGKASDCRHNFTTGDLQLLRDAACHQQGQRLHLLGRGRKDKFRSTLIKEK